MKTVESILGQDGFSKEDIVTLLNLGEEESKLLFEEAQRVRESLFGNKVFAYGFVYFSTWCKNSCNFCYFRKENKIDRYRKTKEEIMDIALSLKKEGVHLLDLTMGEDPYYEEDDFDGLIEMVGEIKEKTALPVMVSFGRLDNNIIDKIAEKGVEWYALYQETHNREVFEKLRILQDYDERMKSKLYAKEKNMLIEEGLLVGGFQTIEDIAESILKMGEIGATQMRAMSFVPQEGSPMENIVSDDRLIELKIIAIMRILYKNCLIPASLDVDGITGLKDRINAGANVITSIIPPRSGLGGVAQSKLDIDEGGRTVGEATKILETMGMEIAAVEEYEEYIKNAKQ